VTIQLFLLLAAVYAGASVVQGLTAFGFAVISVPIVAALTSPATAIAYNVVIATTISAQKAFMLREHLDWRWTVKFYLAILPFIPVGVIFISRISRSAALIAMGAYVIAAAALQFVSGGQSVRRLMRSGPAYGVSAVLAGLLSGAFSAPGPAAVPFVLSRYEDPLAGQANLSLFFSMLVVPVLGLHWILGDLRPVEMLRGLVFIPIAVIPTYFGTRWAARMNTARLRLMVAGAMILLGGYLVISSALG
jgi:uncharacterized membrane protein YfcA